MRFLNFTTAAFARRDRYEAWRERPAPSLARLMRTERPEGEFFAHSRVFTLGDVVLSNNRMAGQAYDRAADLIRADGFDGISIAVNLEGRYDGETPSGCYRGGPRSVLVGDMGLPFRQRWTNAHCAMLTFRRAVIRRLVPGIEGLNGLVLSGPETEGLVEVAASLVGRLAELPEEEAGAVGARLVGAVLSCLGSTEGGSLSGEAEPARLRTEIGWILARRFREPDLSVERIAAIAGVSRATLYRAFSGLDGISAHLTRLRLEKAAAALRDPRDRRQITEIAYAMGFERGSSFSRAFREAYGCSPREWRGMAAEGGVPPAGRGAAVPGGVPLV